jgi:hypothetical protein
MRKTFPTVWGKSFSLLDLTIRLEASRHLWFQDERWYDLIVILDDASSEIDYPKARAQFVLTKIDQILACEQQVGKDCRCDFPHSIK